VSRHRRDRFGQARQFDAIDYAQRIDEQQAGERRKHHPGNAASVAKGQVVRFRRVLDQKIKCKGRIAYARK